MEQNIIYFADLFGTCIFAITGAVAGIHKKLDLLGVIVLSCTTGVGGGIFRDCALGATPCGALTNGTYLLLCILTGLTVFRIPRKILNKGSQIIVYFDAVGLGVFTAIGTAKALQYDLPQVAVVLAGIMTAVGGGVIRDILINTTPAVLKQDFYATASLFGGISYLILKHFGLELFPLFMIVSLEVMSIRLLAYHYKVQLPKANTFD